MKLLNSFSVNMLPALPQTVTFEEVPGIPKSVTLDSKIGHADLAAILGMPVNRETVTLEPGEKFIIAQYSGPRLPEGTTTLPNGAKVKWIVGQIYLPPDPLEDDDE